jgi:signal-transduction protein with cAMP-binding, CBS, and nucleotidyltransferase domain
LTPAGALPVAPAGNGAQIDVRNRAVCAAQPDESVWQAAERMHQRVVGTLVVIDADKMPIGIITDRDLVERVLAKARLRLTSVSAEARRL